MQGQPLTSLGHNLVGGRTGDAFAIHGSAQVVDHDLRALLGQEQRDAPAYAPARAGDDCYFINQ